MLTDQDIQKLNTVFKPQFDALSESIDSLAIITKKGFDNTVSKKEFEDHKEGFEEFKDEMYSFKKEATESLFNLDGKVKDVDTRLKKLEQMLEPLFTGYRIMQKEIQELNVRVSRIEQKEGIKI